MRWVCVIFGAALCTAAIAQVERYEGIAYSSRDGSVLYHETHWLYREGNVDKHLVLYSCTDGAPFARKLMTESSNAAAPDFDFYDARLNYREGVSGAGPRRIVYAQAKQSEVELGVNDVIDAGFDEYLRSHWNTITLRSTLHAAIVVPSKLTTVPVVITETGDGDTDVLRMRVELNAWYRLIAPSMMLAYRRADHRLLEFQGIGTIRGADGSNLDVHIIFPPRLRNTSIDSQDALTAARLTLNGHCRS